MILDLVHNVALLVALAVGSQMLARRTEWRPLFYGLATGLMFGLVGIVGMMTPIHFAPGVIYDGRSIVLSLAGLFGGPTAAVVSAACCGAYRLYLGGAGATAGVAVVVEAAALGTILYYMRRRDEAWVGAARLWIFSLLVHALMMVLQLSIPDVGWEALRRVGPSVLVFYPLGFLLIAQVFLNSERNRKTEQALRQSEERLVEAQRIARMGDFTWNVSTGEASWSEALYDLLKYDRSEKIDYAKVNAEIHHPDDLQHVTRWLNDCLASGTGVLTPNEYRVIRKDGAVIHVRTMGVIQKQDDQSPRVFATILDITDLKRTEEALRESKERLALVADATTDLVYEWNVDNDTLEWFGDWDTVLGYDPGEIDWTIRDWMRLIHPEDARRLADSVERHRTSIQPIHEIYRIRKKDGTWAWWEDRGTPILNAKGMPAKWVGSCSDITEHKRAEETRLELEAQLRQSQKLEAIGQLAGGVAHDFNNILTAILGNVELSMNELRVKFGPDHNVVQSMEQIEKSARRAAALTRQLLTFSRRGCGAAEGFEPERYSDWSGPDAAAVNYRGHHTRDDRRAEIESGAGGRRPTRASDRKHGG